MKGRFNRFVILVAASLVLALAPRGVASPADEKHSGSPDGRTTVSDHRGPTQSTHRPEQLWNFVLPEMVIDGLTLDAALVKLKGTYDEVCRKTGDTPLALTFVTASEKPTVLHIKLPNGTFQTSLQLLASAAGMKAERKELEYRFEPLTSEKRLTKILRVAPDFASSIEAMAIAPPPENQRPITVLLAEIGLGIDPAAKISLSASGVLTLANIRAADAAAITDFTQTLSSQRPKQIRFTVKVLELAKNANVTLPEADPMTDGQSLRFQRKVSEQKGVDLMTLPTVISRCGEPATVEIVRDFPPHEEDAKGGGIVGHQTGGALEGAVLGHDSNEEAAAPKTPKSDHTGKVMEAEGNLTGLKLDVKLDYTDSVGSIDPSTKKAVIEKRAHITEAGFFTDGTTRQLIQTHADGSKTVLLAKAELIDATGRPCRENR